MRMLSRLKNHRNDLRKNAVPIMIASNKPGVKVWVEASTICRKGTRYGLIMEGESTRHNTEH